MNTLCYFKKIFLSTHIAWLLIVLISCKQTNTPIASLEVARKGLHTASLSADGEYAIVGSIYDGGSYWRVSDSQRIFNWNHQAEEQSTLLHSDISFNQQWALSSDTHTLVLWNTLSGKGERYWSAPSTIHSVSLAADGRLALLGLNNNTAVVFDILRGGIKQTLKHTDSVTYADFSADGRTIITGSQDRQARIWHLGNNKPQTRIKHADDVQLVKLSDDASLALSVSKYDRARIWRTHDAHIVGDIPIKAEHLNKGVRFVSARFSADNQWLLTGRADQIVELWKLKTMSLTSRWRLPKRNKWKPTSASVLDVAFAPFPSNSEPHTVFAIGSNGFIHTLMFESANNKKNKP